MVTLCLIATCFVLFLILSDNASNVCNVINDLTVVMFDCKYLCFLLHLSYNPNLHVYT